jgi:hypothetical protein
VVDTIDAVVGVVCKTGSAIIVTLRDDDATPALLDRRTIALCDDTHSRFVFHDASERAPADARAFVERCETATARCAKKHVGALVRDLERARARLVRGALVASGRPFAALPLDRVLASHSLVHAAEGNLYRSVALEAFTHLGVALEPIPRRDLSARAGVPTDVLAALGREVGPPWRREHKDAALAALAVSALSV